MSFRLTASKEELASAFYSLFTRADVAHLLDIDEEHLIYYLYRLPKEKKYITFKIPKKSGDERTIQSPTKSLKILQNKLSQILNAVYKPKKCVHGFVEGRSIRTNAMRHKNQRYVFNFDLKDFFPSINFGRVRGMFISKPYNIGQNAATILAQISCFDNELPQGAPTSPMIANMICSKLDSQLQRLARENRCYYTRYADDITFSTSLPEFPTSIAINKNDVWEIGDDAKSIVENNGFEIQHNKVRGQANYQRQVVTGLTVNEFPNISRKFVRQIRAMLHDWEINGYEAAQDKNRDIRKSELVHRNPENPLPEFKYIVQGKISYLQMVRDSQDQEDQVYTHLLDKYNYLIERDGFGLPPKSEPSEHKVFISYSRKDERFMWKLYKRLIDVGESLWVDKKNIRSGKNWDEEIQSGLEECSIMILIVSQSAMNSKNVAHEWKFFETKDKPIIPLFLSGSIDDLPFQLRNVQWIDFRDRNNFLSKLNELRKTLQDLRIELNGATP